VYFVWGFLFGRLIRNSALPDSVKQERYDQQQAAKGKAGCGTFLVATLGVLLAVAVFAGPVGTVALGGDGVRGRQWWMRRSRACPVVPVPSSAFARFRFPPETVVLAVRWYLRFGLSYRDVEELLGERGFEVDHVTLYRWVQRFTPLLVDAARPCRHRVGDRWFVDETYVKVAGQWRYVYRAIDQHGQIIDVFVSARRDPRLLDGSS
jgi:hypothetical protein